MTSCLRLKTAGRRCRKSISATSGQTASGETSLSGPSCAGGEFGAGIAGLCTVAASIPCYWAAPRQPPPSPLPAVAAVAASVVTLCTPPLPHLPYRSVEMSVTPEYQVRPPMAPTHFFLIDVSQVGGARGQGRRGVQQVDCYSRLAAMRAALHFSSRSTEM